MGAGVLAVIVVGGILGLLATRRPPPAIPRDAAHRGVRGEAGCLECHGVDGAFPQGKNHPLTQRCFQCHP